MTEHEIERRAELAAKVQVLDERTHHITKAVDRIEKALEEHTMKEEAAFHHLHKTEGNISKMLFEFKEAIDEKLDSTVTSVESKVQPIRDEFAKIKTVYKVLATIGGVAVTVFMLFKEQILRFFA